METIENAINEYYKDEEEKKKRTEKRLNEIEKELRAMQKQWIEMYETIMRLIHEKNNN